MLKVTKVVLKNVQDENQRLHNSNDELEQQMLELRKDMKSLKKQSRELESPINNAQQIKQEFTKLGNAQEENKQQDQDVLPIVVTHGMGDSCFNPGMKNITSSAGAHLGNTYTHIHQLLISFP